MALALPALMRACCSRTFRTPGWDRTDDIEAGRVAMAGAMSAHTGVGVTALAAPEYAVEIELNAAQAVVRSHILSAL